MWNALAVLLSTSTLAATQPAGVVTNSHPTWSPNGQWIAFASDRTGSFDVWKTDGVHVRRVIGGGSDPAWSPDAGTIAFVSQDGSTTPSIYVTDATGTSSARRRVAYDAWQPSWSPSASLIAFTAPTGGCERGLGIWVMRRDGAVKRLLVESPDEFTDYMTPAWSPNGKRLAYAIPNSDQGESGISIVSTTARSTTSIPVTRFGAEPSWSPDGSRIAFSRPANGGFGGLYVIDLRWHGVRRLTRMPASGPAWSPRGKRIAFATRASDGSVDIYLIDPDGSHLLRLTRS